MSKSLSRLELALAVSIPMANAQPVLAMGGGGPPVSQMTKNYCTEMVVNKGITDIARFQQEVAKCVANPVTYPPTYK